MAEIEYFYSAQSAYAYLGSPRFAEIVEASGARVVHKVIDLNKVVKAGGPGFTGGLTPARRRYFFEREIERWAEYRGLPLKTMRPTHHDNDIALANGMLIAAERDGADIMGLGRAMMQAHWAEDADLDDRETLLRLAHAAHVDGEALMAAAETPEIQAVHEANTAEAIERAVFGAPTYVVDGDMFYGQDRLELVARALEKPFADTWGKT